MSEPDDRFAILFHRRGRVDGYHHSYLKYVKHRSLPDRHPLTIQEAMANFLTRGETFEVLSVLRGDAARDPIHAYRTWEKHFIVEVSDVDQSR